MKDAKFDKSIKIEYDIKEIRIRIDLAFQM